MYKLDNWNGTALNLANGMSCTEIVFELLLCS
jgi:hypothetical protein